MYFVENDSTDAYFNLALEEAILTRPVPPGERREPLLMLWRNDSAIIVGRHQNAHAEIDAGYVAAHGIKLVRRMTGGGAVYHDLGNLNYSFFMPERDESWGRPGSPSIGDAFRILSQPVAETLREMGVPAELTGRNDLTTEGRKISGVAQTRLNGWVLCHGTLLFDSDLDAIGGALRPDPEKFRSKAVASVRARVGNIADFLPGERREEVMTKFQGALFERLARDRGAVRRALTEDEVSRAEELRRDKYATREWNYGSAPKFGFRSGRRWPCGRIEVAFDVAGGMITRAQLFGDFFALSDVGELESALVGTAFDREALGRKITDEFLAGFFPGLSSREFLDSLFE